MNNLSKLLKDLADARSKVESAFAAKKARGEMFNVFELCGVGHYETMHSSILAEFLSPAGTHGMKNAFLKKFSECFGVGECSGNAIVKTESSEKIGGESVGRFDLLIQDESTRHVCIIENKIFAGEQPEQLKRYKKWLDKKAKEGWNTHLVFLTLDGHESVTAEDEKDYIRVAYSSLQQSGEEKMDIVTWLKQCADLATECPFVRNAILQYSDHLENLVTGERAMSEKIIDVLLSNMKAAQDAYDNYTRACERAADKILAEETPSHLGRAGQWTAYPRCSWKKGEQGVLYVPQEGEELKGQIYVLFDQKELFGCEIVLFQEKDDANSPIRIKKEQAKSWENQGWNVDCAEWSEYPIWRPVRCGVKEEENSVIYKYGAFWDGEFFDRMNSNLEFHKMVIDEIVKGIKDLYKIQKEISKN